jgi:hypothetical protein
VLDCYERFKTAIFLPLIKKAAWGEKPTVNTQAAKEAVSTRLT